MKVEELRVGNFAFISDNQLVKIDRFEALKFAEHMYPIPLTEEILLHAGLERLNNAWIIDNGARNDQGEKISGEDTFTLFDHSFGKCTNLKFQLRPISYLHQLQNLYFALTGEELTIHHSQLTTP